MRNFKVVSALLFASKLILVQSKATLPLYKTVCGEGIGICDGLCCGPNGYCGTGMSFCGNGCQEEYGLCFHIDENVDEEVTADINNEDNDSASDDEQNSIPSIPLKLEGEGEIPAIPLNVEGLFPNPPEDYNVKKDGVTYGEINKITFYSNFTKTERPAIVITPPNYDANKKYPVLYLCHGGNGDENDYLTPNMNLNEIYGNLLAEGKTEPMILVLANNRVNSLKEYSFDYALTKEHMNDWANFLYEFPEDLMPYIESHYPVLTGRENTAIAGFSMGGREALYIGIKRPDLVSYIAAFSPSNGILEYSNEMFHEDGLFTEETFALSKEYIDNTMCFIIGGQNDSFVGWEPKKYHKILVSNGFEENNYYYDVPGDHVPKVWNHGLYNFFTILFKN